MGGTVSIFSKNKNICDEPDEYDRSVSQLSRTTFMEWKVFPSHEEAVKKYRDDGTLRRNLDLDQLEFRMLLDEPIAQKAIGKFAATVNATNELMCWCDIQEFKRISAPSYRRSTGYLILKKYMDIRSDSFLNLTADAEVQRLEAILLKSEQEPSLVRLNMFDNLQYSAFLQMVQRIYKPFRVTDECAQLNDALKHKYNNVRLSHFEYFSKLGEGGFGFVVKCKKKSTGKYYAMKLQPKVELMRHNKHDLKKVCMEVVTMAACQHPFIVSLVYAFQTETLTALVVELSCADLDIVQYNCGQGRMKEEHVRFYAAEMVLALGYLHQIGLIYRDLKPHNVLLHEDGHIRLIDLGCVMDVSGKYSGDRQRKKDLFSILSKDIGQSDEVVDMNINAYSLSGVDSERHRSLSFEETAADYNADGMIGEQHDNEDGSEEDAPEPASMCYYDASNGRDAVSLKKSTGHSKEVVVVNEAENENSAAQENLLKKPELKPTVPSELPIEEKSLDIEENHQALKELPEMPHEYEEKADQKPTTSMNNDNLVVNKESSGNNNSKDKKRRRKKVSVMGTLGYMAPEMVLMLNPLKASPTLFGEPSRLKNAPVVPPHQRFLTIEQCKKGYTSAVDWWALGITVYKLLTSVRPFAHDNGGMSVTINNTRIMGILKENLHHTEYVRLFQVVQYPSFMSKDAADFIGQLLNVDPDARLGSGRQGLRNIKKHPFFADIDWNRLEQKQLDPPVLPDAVIKSIRGKQNSEKAETIELGQLLSQNGRTGWFDKAPDPVDQKYFADWEFVALQTIKEEAGLSRNRKVLRRGRSDRKSLAKLPKGGTNAKGLKKRLTKSELIGAQFEVQQIELQPAEVTDSVNTQEKQKNRWFPKI